MKFIFRLFYSVCSFLIINQSTYAQEYCTPAPTSVDGTGIIIVDLSDGDIYNETGLEPGNYGDYSDLSFDAFQSTTFSFEVRYGNTLTYNTKIWIDWNNDGVFTDAAPELVFTGTTAGGAINIMAGTITVPLTAIPGPHRLRIGGADIATPTPCYTGSWASYEDYTINVLELPPCSDVELSAGILVDFSICPSTNFTLDPSGLSISSGLDIIWQSSPSGTDVWTTIAGEEGFSLDVGGILEPTDYRIIVLCSASGDADTAYCSVAISDFTECYCIPAPSTSDGTGITIVDIDEGAIHNVTGAEPGFYGDYSDSSFDAYQSTIVPFQVTYGHTFTYYTRIWIDWNNDGIFENLAPELVFDGVSTGGSANIMAGTFTVPLTATPGPHRLRIGGADATIPGPCYTGSWGAFEDYTINVIELPSCSESLSAFPESISTVASPNMVCETGSSTLSIDEDSIPVASGITYQWQQSNSPTGPWTNVGVATITSYSMLMEDISDNTYFRCIVFCEEEAIVTSIPVMVESVTPTAPTLTEGQTCGPGPVTLTGDVASGTIYWFESETGGTPFATGESIETPPIDITTTFYASGGAFPPAEIQVGTSTSTTTGAGPFAQGWRRTTAQMMYKKDQLIAAGATAGNFDELRFYLASAITYDFPDYTISIKTVPASMTTLTWQTDGFTTIFGGTGTVYSPDVTGWQSFPFAPMYWDGESHIIVQVCWSQMAGWTSAGDHQYTNTFGQMLYNQTDAAGTSCGVVGTSTSSSLPNAIFNFTGCTSERIPVVAHVRDTPTVNIDFEDGTYCLYNNQIEIGSSPNPQPAGTDILWSTGDTEESIIIVGHTPETNLWVEVTNEWGCKNSDTVHITLNPSPEVDLGADTLVCEGGTVPLNAGDDGVSYYWNTGETDQEIIVDDGGTYTVLVTNEYGCMSTDTINVTIEGYAPTVDGIIVHNLDASTFQFTPFHPMNVLTYEWDFGDDSPTSLAETPTHTYSAPGTYLVTLTVTSTCGTVQYYTYTSMALGIDDEELSKNNLKLYPNPTDNLVTIESLGDVTMNHVKVINMLGQEVLTQNLDKKSKITLDVSRLASGMYQVQIESNKGMMVKKFQIIK